MNLKILTVHIKAFQNFWHRPNATAPQPWQEKVDATLAKLRPKATCCSDREVAVLATAIQEVIQNKNVDPFEKLMVIQVVP